MKTETQIQVVDSPMVKVWKETLKDNNVFSPTHQGQSEHKGTFDGIKYEFSVSHTLGSLFYAGIIGKTPFIVQMPRNQTVQMYIGDEVTSTAVNERDELVKEGIQQAFFKSIGGDDEYAHDLYKHANPHSESQITELLDCLFVVEKSNVAFAKVINKNQDPHCNFNTFKQSIRHQLGCALTRIIGAKSISQLDKVFTDQAKIDLNTVVVSSEKSIIPLEFGTLIVEKDGPIQIKFSLMDKDCSSSLYESSLRVNAVFYITPENKYVKEHIENAISFYFDHFNINN
ncbi:hypothetical protein [Aeromonas phage ZPAH34]|uniref:hypothetical protein n=1 Tax=Aeromonas phage ZPAH34 TaxID=2924888 RepID=UPI0023299C1B|nr:hypothetical protein PQD16_gp001 [Aeromonas phage ZPAH34]UOX39446.1 hypothetical protein [Aeromonas phage ZPAH34]